MISNRLAENAATPLLSVLRDIETALALTLREWETVVRLGRQARLLGLLGARLQDRDDLWGHVPLPVRGHLQSALNYSAHRTQMVNIELAAIAKVLPEGLPVVVLKGAAYILQSQEFSRGRIPNDVDILVARKDLDAAESALLAAGWRFQAADAYAERYYREWSHELPPLRFPGHALEIDLHHTISPVTSRIRPNNDLLFSGTQAVCGSRFLTLHPGDQIIHAAIHLFQDSELSGRLRDLIDFSGLLTSAIRSDTDWDELVCRAREHGASDTLWYALHFVQQWLGTHIPADLTLVAPPAWRVRAMDWMVSRIMAPVLPGSQTGLPHRIASSLGVIRYHWLRMPPGLLIRHSAHKAWRSVVDAGVKAEQPR